MRTDIAAAALHRLAAGAPPHGMGELSEVVQELARRCIAAEAATKPRVDLDKLAWRKRSGRADSYAEYAMRDFEAIGLEIDNFDECAEIDTERVALRWETDPGYYVVAIVTVDHDADAREGGWHDLSRATRVEVVRA